MAKLIVAQTKSNGCFNQHSYTVKPDSLNLEYATHSRQTPHSSQNGPRIENKAGIFRVICRVSYAVFYTGS
jgi:hypothetical protein